MSDFPWELAVLAAVFAVNRAVRLVGREWFFWSVQALDVALALWIGVVGLPGLSGFSVVNWMIAALLGYHVVENFVVRDRARTLREREEGERRIRRELKGLRDDP